MNNTRVYQSRITNISDYFPMLPISLIPIPQIPIDTYPNIDHFNTNTHSTSRENYSNFICISIQPFRIWQTPPSSTRYGGSKDLCSLLALTDLNFRTFQANSNKANTYSIRKCLFACFQTPHKSILQLRSLLPSLLQNYIHNRTFKIRVSKHDSSIRKQ